MSGHISIDVNPYGETNSRLQVSEQFAYNLAQTLKVKHDIGRARGRGLYGAERSEFAVIKTPKAMACRDGTCLNKNWSRRRVTLAFWIIPTALGSVVSHR